MIKDQTYTQVSQGFGAIASAFVIDSLRLMIPWLITMAIVVVLDLLSGICKSVKLGVRVRFSKFVRDSISKFTTYFAFVVAACMFQIAYESEDIAKQCCAIVIVIEAISIIGNILKMKGYNLDFVNVLEIVLSKKFKIAKEEFDGVITKDEEKNEKV